MVRLQCNQLWRNQRDVLFGKGNTPHTVSPSLQLRPNHWSPYHLAREIWKWGKRMKVSAGVHLRRRSGVGWERSVTYNTRRAMPYLVSSSIPYACDATGFLFLVKPGQPSRAQRQALQVEGAGDMALGAREAVQRSARGLSEERQ